MGGGSFVIEEKNGQRHQRIMGTSNQRGRKARRRSLSNSSAASRMLRQMVFCLVRGTSGNGTAGGASGLIAGSRTSGKNSSPTRKATSTARCAGKRLNRRNTTGNQANSP